MKLYFIIRLLSLSVLLLLCASIVNAQTTNEKIDLIKEQFPIYYPAGHESTPQNMALLRNELEKTGEGGFNLLIEQAMEAKDNDFIKTVNFISLFGKPHFNGNRIIDLIQYKGINAKDDRDVSICFSLYSNLGFFKPTNEVINFLVETVGKERLHQDWPVLSQKITRNMNGKMIQVDMSDFENQIRLTAIVALFHIGTPDVLDFLKYIGKSEPEGSYIKYSIDFYFEKIKKYGSVTAFLLEKNKDKNDIIE